jgi:MSHA biogenesis protein MshI
MSQQINLYEERLRPHHEFVTGNNVGVAALIVLAAVASAAVWANRGAADKSATATQLQAQVSEQQTQLMALTKAVSERRVSSALSADLENAREMVTVRAAAIEQLESGRQGNVSGFSGIFSGFAHLAEAGSNLWLTGFAVTRGGEAIEIHGRMLEASALPIYMQRLGSEAAFAGRQFATLEMLDRDQGNESAEKPAAPQRFMEFTLRSEAVADGPKGAQISEGHGR